MKLHKAKIHGYSSLIGGIIGIACALVLFAFAIFMDYGIITVIMGVLSLISGGFLIYSSLSHEASLEENSELIDERSVQLAYESKARAFDFIMVLSHNLGVLLIIGYFMLKIEPIAYFYFGVWIMQLAAIIAQTVSLNRLDNGKKSAKPRKCRIRVKRLRSIIVGLGLLIFVIGNGIWNNLFLYYPVAAVLLALFGLVYAASGFTFKRDDENSEK